MMISAVDETCLERIETCPICGGTSVSLYENLPDRTLSVRSTVWNMSQCARCSHAWLSPRLKANYIGLAYEGYSDQHWPQTRAIETQAWKRLIKQGYMRNEYGYRTRAPLYSRLIGLGVYFIPPLKKRLDRQIRWLASPPGRLLDIGPGNGDYLQRMQQLGWDVRGVDIDPVSAEKARAKGVSVDVGYLAEQQYADEHFDAITMSHVVEHLHDPMVTLKECHRIMKRGGVLTIITPNIQSLGHRIFGSSWQPLEVPRHLNIFGLPSMKIAILSSGFAIDRLTAITGMEIWMWLKSNEIRQEGRYVQKHSSHLMTRFEARCAYKWQAVRHRQDGLAGEEILAICRK